MVPRISRSPLSALLCLLACAHPGGSLTQAEGAPFDLLGAAEIAPYRDPLEAVTTLRRQWFAAQPTDESRSPLLLIDGIPMRRMGVLAGVPKYRIVEIRYLSPYEVKVHFGIEANDGAVQVTTRR